MIFFSPKNYKLGDFSLIENEGKLYCLFIENEKKSYKVRNGVGIGNNFGLASTTDYFNWTYLGTVKKPDNFLSLWAQHVIKEEEFLLFYSAVLDTPSPMETQKVSLAKSNDLKKWEDLGTIITPKDVTPYYSPKKVGKFCWRDPFIVKKGDYYCLLAAKIKNLNACIALLKSSNLKEWKTEKPLLLTKYFEVETPSIQKIGAKYFLLFGENKKEDYWMRYAVSNEIVKDYQEPKNNVLTPPYCYSGRIIKIKDNYLFYHWIRDKFVGKTETYLAPPKIVEVKGDYLFLKKHPSLNDFEPLKKKITNNFSISLQTENEQYTRKIHFKKVKEGLLVDDRIIPLKTNKESSLEIYIIEKFMEVYLDGYFVYAAVIEKDKKNYKKLTITTST